MSIEQGVNQMSHLELNNVIIKCLLGSKLTYLYYLFQEKQHVLLLITDPFQMSVYNHSYLSTHNVSPSQRLLYVYSKQSEPDGTRLGHISSKYEIPSHTWFHCVHYNKRHHMSTCSISRNVFKNENNYYIMLLNHNVLGIAYTASNLKKHMLYKNHSDLNGALKVRLCSSDGACCGEHFDTMFGCVSHILIK